MRKLIFNLLLVLLTGFSLASPTLAADTNSQLFDPCTINSKTAKSPICKDKNKTDNPVISTIKTASDLVAIATGVAAVILIIIGGFTMVTSAGNTEAVASARKRVTYAVIGLVIVALAWTIIAFVTNSLLT